MEAQVWVGCGWMWVCTRGCGLCAREKGATRRGWRGGNRTGGGTKHASRLGWEGRGVDLAKGRESAGVRAKEGGGLTIATSSLPTSPN
jgi:hypothetical protein